MDTDSFNTYVQIDDIYKEIAEDFETIFDTANYEQIDHCLKEKIKK